MKKSSFIIICASVVSASFAVSDALASINPPSPQSQGKYYRSRGTKGAPEYSKALGISSYDREKGFEVGPTNVYPILHYTRYWDNNVFYEQDGRDEDWVSLIGYGMGVDIPLAGEQHLLSASAVGDSEFFSRFSANDHTDTDFQFAGEFNFVPFTIQLHDRFGRSVSRSDTEFTDRIARDVNVFHGLLEVPFAQFFLETEVIDFDLDFRREPDDVFDRHDFSIYQRAGLDIGPNTQAMIEYGYQNISYDNAEVRDGDVNQVMAGLRGALSDNLTYQAWVGGHFRIYDTDERPDFEGIVARGSAQYNYSETGNVILQVDRSPQESTFDGQSFYVRNRLNYSLQQQVMERVSLQHNGYVHYNEYSRVSTVAGDTETRRDYNWQLSAGLEYRMPNDLISFVAEYRFLARDSNTEGLDYDAQRVSMSVRASF